MTQTNTIDTVSSMKDIPLDKMGEAIEWGEELIADEYLYARVHKAGDVLRYQFFRGPKILAALWFQGQFGEAVVEACQDCWRLQGIEHDFEEEAIRPDVDPKELDKHPYAVGSYRIDILGYNNAPLPPTEEKISRPARDASARLKTLCESLSQR